MSRLAKLGFPGTTPLLAFLLAPMALASQSPPPTPQLRISTHLVQIGVIVRDAHGPVANLTKDDFLVLDRGEPQAIRVFSAESSPAVARPAQPLPPNTYSDLSQYGASKPRSVTIVLLDNLNTMSSTSPQPYESTPYWLEDHALAAAKQRLIEFLKKMDASDRIAIYGLTDKLHVLCDFTCDRDQLLAVVSRYDATSITRREAVEPGSFHFDRISPDENDARPLNADAGDAAQMLATMNNENRGQATMAALVAIAAHAADIPGRKNLLWLTGNLPFSGHAIAEVLSRGNIAAYPVDARGLLARKPLLDISEVTEEDDYAEGKLGTPAAMAPQPTGIQAMEEMAEDTGGRAFVNTNDLTGAIRKVVEDSAVTYTLGFYLDPHAVDGKFHKLRVEVKRAGLTLSYPKGYFAFKDEPATQDESHNSFLAAIRSPLDSSAIPLQVKVDRVNQPAAHSLQIVGTVGMRGIVLAKDGEVRKGSLDVYTLEQDPAGNVLQQINNRLNLKLTEQQYQAYLQSGIFFNESVQPKNGATALRVLVQFSGNAEVGSVIIPLAGIH